jgi:hypothetical protein
MNVKQQVARELDGAKLYPLLRNWQALFPVPRRLRRAGLLQTRGRMEHSYSRMENLKLQMAHLKTKIEQSNARMLYLRRQMEHS